MGDKHEGPNFLQGCSISSGQESRSRRDIAEHWSAHSPAPEWLARL